MTTVRIECVCPGSPHDADDVTLRETLDFRAALAVRNDFALLHETEPDASAGDMLAFLTEQYVLRGVESWTLTNEHGKPLPVSREAIRSRLLSNPLEAAAVADAADELYRDKVILPLLTRASASSPTTPTASSTSAPTSSSPTRNGKARSSRSSTTTTPTDAIETTSPVLAGASSSSPN